MKTYWPYIPMLLIVVGGLVFNNYLSSKSSVLGYQSNFSQTELLKLTNSSRTSAKLATLQISSQLDQAAQQKASDIVSGNYWSHIAPSGQTPSQLLASTGYQFIGDGENLAYGFNSANDVMTGWLNSLEHKANILNKDYSQVGFGIAESKNFMGKGPEVIVVAEYAQPSSAFINNNKLAAASLPSQQNVSRIQVITKSNNYEIVTTAIIVFGLTYLLLRHGIRIRKLVQKGELYAIGHPVIDIAVVAAVMFLLVYSQSAGFIG
jgi:hypothetical protein